MAKRVKHKTAHTKVAPDEHMHGDISYRKHTGKPQSPQDHPAAGIKNASQEHNATQLGMNPAQAVMPQTMQGPADYPGQELGA